MVTFKCLSFRVQSTVVFRIDYINQPVGAERQGYLSLHCHCKHFHDPMSRQTHFHHPMMELLHNHLFEDSVHLTIQPDSIINRPSKFSLYEQNGQCKPELG